MIESSIIIDKACTSCIGVRIDRCTEQLAFINSIEIGIIQKNNSKARPNSIIPEIILSDIFSHIQANKLSDNQIEYFGRHRLEFFLACNGIDTLNSGHSPTWSRVKDLTDIGFQELLILELPITIIHSDSINGHLHHKARIIQMSIYDSIGSSRKSSESSGSHNIIKLFDLDIITISQHHLSNIFDLLRREERIDRRTHHLIKEFFRKLHFRCKLTSQIVNSCH